MSKQSIYEEFVKAVDALVGRVGMSKARSLSHPDRPSAIDQVRLSDKFKLLNWSYIHARNIYYRLCSKIK